MDNAFKPLGNTVAITAASTAPTGVQAGASSTAKATFAGQYRIINAGSVTVHLGRGRQRCSCRGCGCGCNLGQPGRRYPAGAWCRGDSALYV